MLLLARYLLLEGFSRTRDNIIQKQTKNHSNSSFSGMQSKTPLILMPEKGSTGKRQNRDNIIMQKIIISWHGQKTNTFTSSATSFEKSLELTLDLLSGYFALTIFCISENRRSKHNHLD